MLTALTIFTTLFWSTLTTLAGPTSATWATWAAVLRPVGRAPAFGLHPINDPVKLFDQPVEPAGRVARLQTPLRGGPLVGPPRKMHSACHARQHNQRPSHGQPFQSYIHCKFS